MVNKEIVEISYDKPNDKNWLCPDNIKMALEAYCKNTRFQVKRLDVQLLIHKI